MKQNKGKSLKRLESFSSEKKPQSLEVWGVKYIIPDFIKKIFSRGFFQGTILLTQQNKV